MERGVTCLCLGRLAGARKGNRNAGVGHRATLSGVRGQRSEDLSAHASFATPSYRTGQALLCRGSESCNLRKGIIRKPAHPSLKV